MKSNKLMWLIIPAAWAACPFHAHAQNYSIDWFTIGGGGGESTGGVYSLTATIGEPDAGMLSGGTYSLSGGFLSVVAENPPLPAPELSIWLSSPNAIVLSWSSTPGFQLEQTEDFAPMSWSPVGTSPQMVGNELQVMLQAPIGHRFYRLVKRP